MALRAKATPITVTRRLGAATLIATEHDLSIALPGRQPVDLRPTDEELIDAIDMLMTLKRRRQGARP